MTTTKRVAALAGAALFVIVAAAVLYLSFADFGWLRPRLEALVADATGRELRIGGEFELNVLPRPSLVATDVTFANASWGDSAPMASAGRLDVELGLWSLLSGPIRIKRLELTDIAVLLEQNAAGEGNWVLSTSEPADSAAAVGDMQLPVIVERASIADVEVLLRRPERDDVRIAVAALELATEPNGAGTIEAAGSAIDRPLALNGAFAPGGGDGTHVELEVTVADAALRAAADVQPRTIALTLFVADVSRVAALLGETAGIPAVPLEFVGTLVVAADRYELRDATAKLPTAESRLGATIPRGSGAPLELELSIAAPDVSALRADLPALDLVSSLKVTISPDRIAVDPLSIELGDSDFTGSGFVVLGDVMALALEGQSKLIDLTPFEAPPEGEAGVAQSAAAAPATNDAAASEWVFVEDELPFARLRALDLSADLTAAEVRSGTSRAQNVVLEMNGRGGVYDVKTSFDVADGGAAEGHFVFDAAGEEAVVDLELAARDLLLNVVSGDVADPAEIPPLGFSAKVRSTGRSPRALASGANGRVTLTQGAGRVDNAALGVASSDILAQIFGALNPFAKKEPYSNWDCTVVALNITDGVGEIVPMLSQGEKLLIVGRGTVDLKTEKLDIEFNTKPRGGVGVTADMFVTPFVKLGGTLAKPGVGMNAQGTLLAGGAAALTGGLSLLVQGLADRATAEADQCAAALAQLEGGGVGAR